MNNLKVVMENSRCGTISVDGKEIKCTGVEISMKAGMLSQCRLTFDARQLEFQSPVELSAVIEKARAAAETKSWLCRAFGHRLDPEANYYYSIDHCVRCERQVQIGTLRIERFKVRVAIAWLAATEWFASRVAWFKPCPECGKKWGRHDDAIEHLPF